MASKIDEWLMDTIDEYRYEPLNDMLKSTIEYKIKAEMPLRFPGDYTLRFEWVDGNPYVSMKFASEQEHVLFMLKYT